MINNNTLLSFFTYLEINLISKYMGYITLSPTLLKLQEKVVLWHMQHDLGMEDSLSKKQYGFKKCTSTETALHKVIHKIEKRIAKKGYELGTFLDIEGLLTMYPSKPSRTLSTNLFSTKPLQAGSKTWSPTEMLP